MINIQSWPGLSSVYVILAGELGRAGWRTPKEIQFPLKHKELSFGKGSKFVCKVMNWEPLWTVLIFLLENNGNGIVFLVEAYRTVAFRLRYEGSIKSAMQEDGLVNKVLSGKDLSLDSELSVDAGHRSSYS